MQPSREELWISKPPAFVLVPEITAMRPTTVARGLKQRLPRRVRVEAAGGGRVRAFAMTDTGGVHLPLFRLKL
jgi:hypothetical protein